MRRFKRGLKEKRRKENDQQEKGGGPIEIVVAERKANGNVGRGLAGGSVGTNLREDVRKTGTHFPGSKPH